MSAATEALQVGGWLPSGVVSARITISSSGEVLSDVGITVTADGRFATVVPILTGSVRRGVVIQLFGFTEFQLTAIPLATVLVGDSRFASSLLDRRTVLPR